jgi:pyrimidine deaminase RibD-like protein
MKISHNFFSNLAFNLAENHIGKTGTNPSVGCVVVKNDSVISTGITSINGRPHAEFNALNKNINFKDSEMYLTLEPCTHYGKTPPCIDLIRKKKIKQVYYCYNDPDQRTFKKAKKILKKKIKKWWKFYLERNIQIIENGGWHFNNLFSPEMISLKLKTFAHNEFAGEEYSNVEVIKKKIDQRKDLFNRGHKLERVDIDETYPDYIIQNMRELNKFIL